MDGRPTAVGSAGGGGARDAGQLLAARGDGEGCGANRDSMPQGEGRGTPHPRHGHPCGRGHRNDRKQDLEPFRPTASAGGRCLTAGIGGAVSAGHQRGVPADAVVESGLVLRLRDGAQWPRGGGVGVHDGGCEARSGGWGRRGVGGGLDGPAAPEAGANLAGRAPHHGGRSAAPTSEGVLGSDDHPDAAGGDLDGRPRPRGPDERGEAAAGGGRAGPEAAVVRQRDGRVLDPRGFRTRRARCSAIG